MPRSSRHKSHKQSKHSSKDARDYLSDSEEDVKMKERSSTREEVASGRLSKESSHSGEKRKLSSSFQSQEGKDGKDLAYPRNGDASEEYVSSKRRKDKVEAISGGSDRWTAVGDVKDDSGAMEKEMRVESLRIDSEKGLKPRESKSSSEVKSKSSRRHESGTEKEERNMASVWKGKEEESRSGSTRGGSKRKSEKDSGRREGRDSKDIKEKERLSDRDSKKGHESKHESEARVNVGSVGKKPDSLLEDAGKDKQVKRAKENPELGILDESHNPELEKELEKKIRKREGSDDRDRYQDARENDDGNVSSKGDRAKNGRYKDERYNTVNHGEKYQDGMEKEDGHRDDKYREHLGGDRDGRRRNDKNRDDGERESRKREDRHRDSGDRDGKYREEDVRLKDDKYREYRDRDNKRRDDKCLEVVKDGCHDSKHYEDGGRDDGLKDEKYRGKDDRLRDSERRDGRHGDDFEREKRVREAKYRDDRFLRERSVDKFDAKNLREDAQSSGLHSRKLSILENSPSHDDRAHQKDVQGRKITSDKDECYDVRSRGYKDQRYEVDKSLTSDARVDLITDRGRSSSRYADVEATSIRSRHQGSPSSGSHATRDQYRLLKQDDLKYRDYAYEERAGHGVTPTREYGSAAGITDKISSSRSGERVVPKDDGLMGELSGERRVKSDIRNSPRQLVDKSPSSTGADRRHSGRFDFRRSDDVEESGQRSGGFKEVRSYYGKEGRRTRDLASETHPQDEPSQGDGDTLSVSSPFLRNSHLSSSSKSFLHPPPLPFRMGIDSPQAFRSAEDDGRMKSNNRHRRNGDPSMVRVQGSPWKGLPNWPSPVANGFMPFQPGPPVGFHPAMQQFPAPPIIGMRPSMELNHPGVPYSIPDGDRFSLHGHHMGWRTPVDDPCPPQLHGWEANDAAIGGESHLSGWQDWHHGRTLQGGGSWETGGDSWKSSKNVASFEMPPAFGKDSNQSAHGPEDPTAPSQSSDQAKIEQFNRSADWVEASHVSDIVEKKLPVALGDVTEETFDAPNTSQKNDVQLCVAYLSMLDVSADLVDPELYSKYKALVNVDEKMLSDSKDDKILYVEVAEAKEKSSSKISSGSLFPTINDSLLQRAMSLYRNQKEELMIACGEHATSRAVCTKGALQTYPENQSFGGHEAEEVKSAVEEINSDSLYIKQSNGLENVGNATLSPNQKSDEPIFTNNVDKLEDKVSNRSTQEEGESDLKVQECALVNSFPMEIESSSVEFPGRTEGVIRPNSSLSNQPGNQNEGHSVPVTKYGSLLLSNVPSTAHEVDVPELTSASVNLSRIHHSPESTH